MKTHQAWLNQQSDFMDNFYHKNKGFVFIESLIVVVVIGILSTVILINVNSTKNKAKSVVLQGQIDKMMVTAEIYHDDTSGGNNSYDDFCDSPDYDRLINAMTTAGGKGIVCGAATQSYCVSVEAPSSGTLCRDSSGKLGNTACNTVGNFCP